MQRLNTYFLRSEFACKCGCGMDTVDASLLHVLSHVREFFGKQVIIKSACRCKNHNKKVGGSKRSQHLKARAADIVVDGVEPDVVADFLDGCHFSEEIGLGRYDTFTHVDTRGYEARWDG